jgi:protein-tyrosine-phosphatase
MKKKVLFVCSANTCRSAVAAAILIEYGHRRYDVSSAGIYARTGEPMHRECAEALEEIFGHGYSAYNHTSTKLNFKHLQDADVIVGVSDGYAAILRANFKEVADKVTAFPEPISDISCLRGESMVKAVAKIRDQVFSMFLSDEHEN